ncbi:cation:proton antiporter [Enterococcus casseliflavus]|uniref:cation:proton antiporter n=1 Tax=Enterococcus casseliflavus TaxID=37734 RepID=UPI002890734B|nr:cation:proton antiporter [Enterococcus casseliflavus]MDT2990833.1 cation:proton antiporter [Enterococcus casseliflavus]MDV7690572.1 cation:proton antiporter [Enterococcus casseliflavus]
MLISVAFVILLGLILGKMAEKLNFPSLVGFLLTGIVLGPFCLDLLSPHFLVLSSDLREIALIIILTRAGLSLDLKDLKKAGRPAILMCFFPATIEILATVLLAPYFLGLTFAESLLLGSIIAAVSPAVIVPRMLRLIHEGVGKRKNIPQIILAGASVDDVFVLLLFTSFLGINQGEQFTANVLGEIPIAILLGLVIGTIAGWMLTLLFTVVHLRDSIKVLIIMSISFLLMSIEGYFEGILPFSGMLSIISLSLTIHQLKHPVAERLSNKFNKLWVAAEIFLFVLVGTSVNLNFTFNAGFSPIIFIIFVTILRMGGVYSVFIGTDLTKKERLFCMVSYIPKATVQAAIGGIPFALGISNGEMMLTVAVISIIITAPVGAFLIDSLYKKTLE